MRSLSTHRGRKKKPARTGGEETKYQNKGASPAAALERTVATLGGSQTGREEKEDLPMRCGAVDMHGGMVPYNGLGQRTEDLGGWASVARRRAEREERGGGGGGGRDNAAGIHGTVPSRR